MAYEILLREQASKAFRRLDKPIRQRVQRTVDRLAEDPRPAQATQLVGDPSTWRVRVGDGRILYQIHEDRLVIVVLDFEHRSKAYGGH
jgi:mRNA interferase RelE/StbE